MARSIKEINEAIVTQIQTEIPELNSSSKVAIFRQLAYVVAVATWSLEQLFEVFKTEQSQLASEQQVHTLDWYRQRALEYQEGKELVLVDGVFGYAPTDDEEQRKIIKQVAVVEAPRQLIIKIKGEDATPLDAVVLGRFETYMNLIKDAGNFLNIVNRPPDELKIKLDVYVDSLLINGAGFSTDTGNPVVEDAIHQFVNDLDFDGVFVFTDLLDALQEVPGIVNPIWRGGESRFGTQSFTAFGDYYYSDAGHVAIVEMDINYL